MTTGDVLQQAAGHTERAAHGKWFRILARLGFVARGVIYALIGVFALDLAFGHRQRNASQTGALQYVAHQPFGEWLLIVIAVGLAAYASWRLMQALLGHGPEGGGENSASYRLQALVSAVIYAAFTLLAIRILTSPNHQAGQKPKTHTAASDVLSLPGGQLMLGIAGVVLIAVGLFQAYKGISRSFVDGSQGKVDGFWFLHPTPLDLNTMTWSHVVDSGWEQVAASTFSEAYLMTRMMGPVNPLRPSERLRLSVTNQNPVPRAGSRTSARSSSAVQK